MRPIRVEFQAFGPYVGYETVDFEAVSSKGLFLICGKTGIGKTMILDAMTFALFGKSSGHGRDDFESMRCTKAEYDKDTFVKFEFENNGDYYLFERRLERKRKNLIASYNAARKNDTGIWQPLMENPREKTLNEKAAEIIGLEYEQFRQVIVLPQGQFERLLTSNSDEKEKILTSIFGEDKWQIIAERFYAKAEKRKNEVKAIQERIRNSLAEANCGTISELKLASSRKKDQIESIEKEYEKAGYETIQKEQQEILTVVKRFGDLHNEEKKIAELEAQKRDRAAWDEELKDARRADKVRLLIEAEKTAEKSVLKRRSEEEAAREKAEDKKKESEVAAKALHEHTEKEKDIEELRKKKVLYESKFGDYEGIKDTEAELRVKKKVASDALNEKNKAQEYSRKLGEAAARLTDEYTSLKAEHDDLFNRYLAGITGDLAAQLKDGEPCPVCGSTSHPHKAHVSEGSITKSIVEDARKARDLKYDELLEHEDLQKQANQTVDDKRSAFEKANADVASVEAQLESKKKNLIEGIDTIEKLTAELGVIKRSIEEYEKTKERITEFAKQAEEGYTDAKAQIAAAEKERESAEKSLNEAKKLVETGLKENNIESREEAEDLLRDTLKMDELNSRIANYDASVKTAKERLQSLKEELDGKKEPDEDNCRKVLQETQDAIVKHTEEKARLSKELEILEEKVASLERIGDGIEDRIRQADEDLNFAKKLRGDTGTGLQRYVLGIMFSSVVAAANKMLEMVHGGRYRLYRSDEISQGSRKKGLELKVFDKNSEEHDGRFVSTLSGGEKFLASLALSIGMSSVAQKSGIKIEALFIDEGFGSLDEDSISDAMNVLNSIQEANGLVGIISHVQILQDQIPVKLRVEQDSSGSHIVQTVG